jgi:hypothetical protein
VAAALTGLMNLLQGADVTPTAIQREAMLSARLRAEAVLGRWRALTSTDLAAVNETLRGAGLGAIRMR